MEQSFRNFEPSSSNTEKILGNFCFSEQIIYRKLSLGAHDGLCTKEQPVSTLISLIVMQTENNWDIQLFQQLFHLQITGQINMLIKWSSFMIIYPIFKNQPWVIDSLFFFNMNIGCLSALHVCMFFRMFYGLERERIGKCKLPTLANKNLCGLL